MPREIEKRRKVRRNLRIKTKGKGRGKTKSAGPPQRTLHGHIDPLKPSKKVTHQMTLHRFMKGGTSKTTHDRLRELVLQKMGTNRLSGHAIHLC